MEETYLLLHLLQRKQWFLRASYLLRPRNLIADSLSRQNQILKSEWPLHSSIVQRILRIWDFPMVDCFATRGNRKLHLYVSPVPDDQVWAEDALSIDWTGLQAYASSPTSIMSKVLEKVLVENFLLVLLNHGQPNLGSFFCWTCPGIIHSDSLCLQSC